MSFLQMQACVVVLVLLCLPTEVHPSSASETKTYYETLQVEPTATGTQIKKSFRSLAVKYHPDKNKSSHTEKTFREIAEAYSVLSDKKKRSLYDLVGHETYLQTETSFDPEDKPQNSFHFSFSDFFDGHLFVDESPSHWSFIRVEEDARYKRYSFQEPNINFYFEDIFENEEDYYY